MASTFMPVNTGDARVDGAMTTSPITPRPDAASQPEASRPVDDATTPTRATFGSALASQKPLPSSPFPQSLQVPEASETSGVPQRENSQHSRKSRDSEDIDMDESEGEEDGNASDDESVNADGTKSGKKKKSQRFYCTDYPPCNLSFTRSEHLARHIRKHTGERPFQCHCSRRFSRLDNLRQHAQTVHVNEDIPIDSLAATGARFQRQIRTDRVRQPGRQRSSTGGSAGGPVRGHSKSLSTSSITSISSIGSAYSARDDMRARRPPPLVMAADPRARLSLESYRNPVDGAYPYRPHSPSEFSTPTSATFSTGQSSPRWGSGVASPISSHSRSHSMYAGSRTPGRRLSVPSSANPFSPQGQSVNRPVFGPGAMNSSNSGAFSPSSSMLSSPTASNFSGRRDSMSSQADEAWRRRTWHPDTRGAFAANTSSNLSNVITPSQFQSGPAPLPVHGANPQSNIRLPGIESFDPLPPRPVTPPRRLPSPMMVDSDTGNRPALLPSADAMAEERRSTVQWDMGLHRGLTKLELTSNSTPPRDSAGEWANQVHQAVQAQAEQVRSNPPTVRFETEPSPSFANANAGLAARAHHQQHHHTLSAPSITTPREAKRHGWYHGPAVTVNNPQGHPEQPADPRAAYVDRMAHPNMNAFTGFPARETQPGNQPPAASNNPNPLRGLEALVAVATSEGTAATAY